MPYVDLQRTWTRRGPAAWALVPLAGLYGLLSALHRASYRLGLRRAERLPLPVIVVGNVVAGGAGKTPVVVALVQHLQAQGLRPGVISRGHGRRSRGVREVLPDSEATDSGDEPLLIARRTGVPVFVGARRAQAGRALLARHPEVQVLVCDDGLQHLALARDIEICVFDDRGVGNGWPLPAGPLREPWPRSVDFILQPGDRDEAVTRHHDPKVDDSPESTRHPGLAAAGTRAAEPGHGAALRFTLQRSLAAQAVDAAGRRRSLADLARQAPLALAGIARPSAFFAMLAEAGCPPASTLPLPDHHDFQRGPPLPPDTCLVCTEKDAVKLWPLRPDAWAVPLDVAIAPAFWPALDARLRPRLSSTDGSQTA